MFYPCISFLEGYIIHRMKRKTPTRYGRLIKNLRVEFHIRFCGTWIPPVSGLNSVMEPLFFLKHLFRNFPGRDQHICRTANAVGKHTQSAYPPKYTSCQRIFCSAFLLGVFRFRRNSGGRDRQNTPLFQPCKTLIPAAFFPTRQIFLHRRYSAASSAPMRAPWQ